MEQFDSIPTVPGESSVPVSPAAIALFACMRLKGVGRRNAIRLVTHAPAKITAKTFYEHLASLGGKIHVTPSDLSKAWRASEKQLKKGRDAGIRPLAITDEAYPARLRTIPDPPAVLFVKGSLAGLYVPDALAIVGTREPTEYGAEVAHRAGKTAAEHGFAVVSGLAHGCDTHAHQGCVACSGVGIAVLAHGLDRVYPAANRGLADRLVEQGGCLVSEYATGTAPIRSAFAERDRIQSGLSDGVFVIETDVKGGTMHTVRFAREQGRALACVDHPEKWRSHEKTKGNQRLVYDRWATPIPDGAALKCFLEKLRVKKPRSTPVERPMQQTSMPFA